MLWARLCILIITNSTTPHIAGINPFVSIDEKQVHKLPGVVVGMWQCAIDLPLKNKFICLVSLLSVSLLGIFCGHHKFILEKCENKNLLQNAAVLLQLIVFATGEIS